MWDDVGMLRTGTQLERAQAQLAELRAELDATGLADDNRVFNLDLARLAEPGQPDASVRGDRRRGIVAREFAWRSFPRGLSR